MLAAHDFEKLLGGKSCLGYGEIFLWNTVIKRLVISEAYYVADFVKIKIAVYRIRGEGLVLVIKLTVTSEKTEAVL